MDRTRGDKKAGPQADASTARGLVERNYDGEDDGEDYQEDEEQGLDDEDADDEDDSDSDSEEQENDGGPAAQQQRRRRKSRRGRRRRSYSSDGLSHDDPYTYSDDSASLSDAYFFPTDDELALPPRYRKEQQQQQARPPIMLPLPIPLPPISPPSSLPRRDYGSMAARDDKSGGTPLLSHITEDGDPDSASAVASALAAASAAAAAPPTTRPGRGQHQWRSRRQRREAQRRRMKQMARERAVAQVRGTPQDPTVWRDPAFAVLFGVQLVAVVASARIWGASADQLPPWTGVPVDGRFHWQQQQQEEEIGLDAAYLDDASRKGEDGAIAMDTGKGFALDDVVTMVAITGLYSFILTFVSFGCMLILARTLLQVLLLFSILLSLTWAIVGLTLDPYGTISMLGFLSVLLTLGCTVLNWSRIRFASTNLFTALCGIRCTADVIILGLVSQVVAFAWCVVWSVAFVGALTGLAKVDCVQLSASDKRSPRFQWDHVPVYLLFLLSFLWTNAVIKNVLQVSVAGAFGAWWCHPREIRPFCTSAVSGTLMRAVTTSLGSVCLASLVVDPAHLLVTIGRCCGCRNGNQRPVTLGSSLSGNPVVSAGLGGCLGSLRRSLDRTLRSCNRWTFTYIGLYGYGFREAGGRALQLFETREWLEVVQDSLVPNVLSMACFVIGGSSGTFAVVLQGSTSSVTLTSQIPTFVAFFTGSVVGYVISTCLLHGLIGSSVNSVLVCFASHPFEFDVNHQRLSKGLRDVWSHQGWESHA
jgi:Plasma-membrane choline transporter